MKSWRGMALAVALLVPVAATAAAGEMSVANFLAKADALRAKGAMALFSSDAGLLRDEGKAAGAAYRARLQKERAAGKPSSCPPKGTRISSDQLMGFLRSYPEAQRTGITMKAAMADYFIKTYPCR